MVRSFNRGNWAELYVLFKILIEPRVYYGNGEFEKGNKYEDIT